MLELQVPCRVIYSYWGAISHALSRAYPTRTLSPSFYHLVITEATHANDIAGNRGKLDQLRSNSHAKSTEINKKKNNLAYYVALILCSPNTLYLQS